ncbi:MAG: hypothetical protein IJN05_11465 [Ruminococcus sp.]|nr:hypothetical protein [Ruminococcus sp.]
MDENKGNNKKGTAGAVITFVLIFLCLTAGLAFSYYKFSQNKSIDTVEAGAIKVYSALEIINTKLDGLENYEVLLNELKAMTPEIFGSCASHTKYGNNVSFNILRSTNPETVYAKDFPENGFAISDVEIIGTEFSFTYYHCLNGNIYTVTFSEGKLGNLGVLCKKADE